MSWPDQPEASSPESGSIRPPLDELSRVRYRRNFDIIRHNASSRASELRELAWMAVTMLQQYGLPPNQLIDSSAQGEGTAWLAAQTNPNEAKGGNSSYWLFAGKIAAKGVRGLVRLDDQPGDPPRITDLKALVTPVTFDEESPDYYWTSDGYPANEPAELSPTSYHYIPAIQTGIKALLQEAGVNV